MDQLIFFKGLLIGIGLSAPLGPIGLVCIRRSLTQGFWYGFFTGLGAASADILYGIIAVFSLTVTSSIIMEYNTLLRSIAGIFLCYLGIYIFKSKISKKSNLGWAHGVIASAISSFFLTLSNPLTLLGFALSFAALNIHPQTTNVMEGSMLLSGVYIGALGWWTLISFVAHSLRTKITMDFVQKINAICGVIILAFGILTILSLFNT